MRSRCIDAAGGRVNQASPKLGNAPTLRSPRNHRGPGWIFAGILLVLAPSALLPAAPTPAPLFSDHAVLQRGKPAPVWGTAQPGEPITVRYGAAAASTLADAEGHWRVVLPPLPPTQSSDLVIEGETTLLIRDVAVGDVWLLSGQSNMEWPLAKTVSADGKARAAMRPWLRHLKMPHRVSSRPEAEFDARWTPCTPSTAPEFSAVGFEFVQALYRDDSIPVGLLNISYGGTVIEAWIGPEGLAHTRSGAAVRERWAEILRQHPYADAAWRRDLAERQSQSEDSARVAGARARPAPRPPVGPGHVTQISGLFHGMIAPVQPAALAGVLWYQGESNVGRPDEYADLLTALITDWRSGFRTPALPFLVVQLPNYRDRVHAWWQVRQAQDRVTAMLPGVHLAVAIDLGDASDKHPRDKSELGRRLALLARRHVFAEAVEAEPPRVLSAQREEQRVVLTFSASTSQLQLRAAKRVGVSFELAGPDGHYQRADVRLDGPTVMVSSPAVRDPVSLRYLCHNDPEPRLYTGDGLPIAPFALTVSAGGGTR
jgi:sialate O-acetylesterase